MDHNLRVWIIELWKLMIWGMRFSRIMSVGLVSSSDDDEYCLWFKIG